MWLLYCDSDNCTLSILREHLSKLQDHLTLNIWLKVSLFLTAPKLVSQETIVAFVDRMESWIRPGHGEIHLLRFRFYFEGQSLKNFNIY